MKNKLKTKQNKTTKQKRVLCQMPGSPVWCLACWRRLLTGGHCISENSALQSSITSESINLDTNPRLGTSLRAGSRMKTPHIKAN